MDTHQRLVLQAAAKQTHAAWVVTVIVLRAAANQPNTKQTSDREVAAGSVG
jgi:hypothetical protein